MTSSIMEAGIVSAMRVMPLIDPAPVAPPGVEGPVNTFFGYLKWGLGIICFLVLMLQAIWLILSSTGRTNQGAEEFVDRFGRIILGIGLGAGASSLTMQFCGV
ncbi:hypothetical protein BKH35_04715 [Actinomyces naeslundii]|uniref:hypothetical protein n=1 Tax=Actinomyces naeslundii TaxID=1655 RepID=UPI00096D3E93|nr:hypothetical protein [Actinomyces naeslundii]OMG29664.1 hypothetical protein BKH35_04715 [Actinomyces naeslundii]